MSDIENDANKPDPPAREIHDAEKLAKSIALQFAREHQERGSFFSTSGRTAFRIWSLVIIVMLMLAALFALDWMLAQIPRPQHRARPDASAVPSADASRF